MSNFITIYKAEIKKIIAKKSVWVALAIAIAFAMLMSATNISAEGHIGYIKDSKEALSELNGKPIDDSFLKDFQNEVNAELKANPDRYEKLMAYDPGAAFMNGAQAIGKSSLFDFIYNVVRDRALVESVTADTFYEKMRESIISDGMELGASDDEINIWLEEFDGMEKPMNYYHADGYYNISDLLFFIGWVLFLNISVALSGVFADEKTCKTDAIILSTKKGRTQVCFAKTAAGITVSLLQAAVIIGTLSGILLAIFGTEGKAGVIQNIIPSSPRNITVGQMFGFLILLAVITTVLFALANMFLSQVTHSSVATMAIQVAILLAGLFNLPKSLGIITKLWQLRPTMAVYYGTFCNMFRYGKLDNITASFLIYGICIVLLATALIISYKKSRVESR